MAKTQLKREISVPTWNFDTFIVTSLIGQYLIVTKTGMSWENTSKNNRGIFLTCPKGKRKRPLKMRNLDLEFCLYHPSRHFVGRL